LHKLKAATSKSNLEETRKTVEKLVQSKVTEFEPTLMKFVKDIKQNAAKAGIDLGDLEGTVQKATKAAKATILRTTRKAARTTAKTGKGTTKLEATEKAKKPAKAAQKSTTAKAAVKTSTVKAAPKTSKKKPS
jgi:hypothetical protein